VKNSRVAISDVLPRRDDSLVVVIGPCSIHDHEQALTCVRLLKAEADRTKNNKQTFLLAIARKRRPWFDGLWANAGKPVNLTPAPSKSECSISDEFHPMKKRLK